MKRGFTARGGGLAGAVGMRRAHGPMTPLKGKNRLVLRLSCRRRLLIERTRGYFQRGGS